MKRARYVGTWPFEVLDTWPNKMPAFVVQDSSFKRYINNIILFIVRENTVG